MILMLAIGAVIYSALLWSNGTTVTPDGKYYLAMGRGASVPRPYCLRALPSFFTSVLQWRIIHALSYVVAMCSIYTIAEAMDTSGIVVALAVMALPAFRQSVAWPVLLDMPLLAIASLTAFVALLSPIVGMAVIMMAGLVHERAPIWCALYALPLMPWWLAVFGVVIAGLYTLDSILVETAKNPAKTGIDWLDRPFKSAIEKHRSTWNNYNVWLRPLGASALGLVTGNWWAWSALGTGYVGCFVAQDRARIYSMAALPLTIIAVQTAGDYAVLIPLINWFVPNTEV